VKNPGLLQILFALHPAKVANPNPVQSLF